MRSYPADHTAVRIANYGADNELTRTFEYCDKAAAAGDIDVSPIECFAAVLLDDQTARIENGMLVVERLEKMPIGLWAIKTRELMRLFSEQNDRGELHQWIAFGLRDLREFYEAVSNQEQSENEVRATGQRCPRKQHSPDANSSKTSPEENWRRTASRGLST